MLFVLGVAAGAVPFAKLQAAPIAFCIGLFSLGLVWRASGKNKAIPTLALLAGAVLPAFVLLAPLFASGKIHHFYYSYLAWGLAYIKEPLSAAELHALIASDPALKALINFSATLGIAFLATLGLFKGKQRSTSVIIIVAYAAVLVGAALFAVVRPGNAFPHYLMLLPPFALILVGALGYAGLFNGLHRGINVGIGIVALFFFIAPVFLAGIQDEHFHAYAYKTSEKSEFCWKHPDLFAWLSPGPADRLFVWGRMPQWYVWTGLTPATRESITYNQTVGSDLAAYFRGRLLDDFNRATPDFVIDATTGKTFNFADVETHGISSFPELAAIVERNYVRLGPAERRDPSCPALFVRKERSARLTEQLVEFRSITASAEKSALYSAARLDDWSVTEDACSDYWLLPNGKPGSARIDFTAEERVKKLLILNTKEGAAFYRGTERIKYTLYNQGSSVMSRELKLRRHPEWTVEVFESPVKADSLAIEILSFEDNGGGLNEVKVIRERP
jgi:hypothetical protein